MSTQGPDEGTGPGGSARLCSPRARAMGERLAVLQAGWPRPLRQDRRLLGGRQGPDPVMSITPKARDHRTRTRLGLQPAGWPPEGCPRVPRLPHVQPGQGPLLLLQPQSAGRTDGAQPASASLGDRSKRRGRWPSRSGKVGGAGPGVRTRLSLTLWQCLATCDSQGPASLESRLTGGQRGPPPGPGRTRGLLLPKNQPLQRWRCICIMRVLYAVGVLESPMQRGPGWKGPREPWRLRPAGAERPTPLSRPDLEPPVGS